MTGTFHTGVVHAVDPIAELGNAAGRSDDPRTQELVGEAHMLTLARTALSARVSEGIRTGAMAETSVALARLIAAVVDQRRITIALDLAGANAGATLPDDLWGEEGFNFLERQVAGIGGGTTEMAEAPSRNACWACPARSPTTRTCPFATCRRGRPLQGGVVIAADARDAHIGSARRASPRQTPGPRRPSYASTADAPRCSVPCWSRKWRSYTVSEGDWRSHH